MLPADNFYVRALRGREDRETHDVPQAVMYGAANKILREDVPEKLTEDLMQCFGVMHHLAAFV